jgi:DedD protein
LNIAMKQRLIGTVVVGCLAIIFIPVLLDGEGVSPPEMSGSIPDSPPMPVVPDIKPLRPEISSDTLSIAEKSVETSAPTRQATNSGNASLPPAPERPKLDTAGIPETWTVRLGSFGEKSNAEALVSRLREQKYKGFSRPINSSRGLLTGVYVGPVLTESEAGRLQQELAEEFELEGVVVQFTIDELEQ